MNDSFDIFRAIISIIIIVTIVPSVMNAIPSLFNIQSSQPFQDISISDHAPTSTDSSNTPQNTAVIRESKPISLKFLFGTGILGTIGITIIYLLKQNKKKEESKNGKKHQ